MPPRLIAIANQHPRLRLDRRALTAAIATLDAHFRVLPGDKLPHSENSEPASASAAPAGELSLVFLTDAALAQLHADFLADPTTTDVITFEGDPALGVAGEICVSVDAAIRHLGATRPSPLAFATELLLYVIHGWLHLAGYDDLVPAKKRVMRRAEARALALLAAARPAPVFSLRPARSR